LVVRVDIGDGVRPFVDIDGPGLVADGPVMRDRPTLLLVHGGPAMDSSVFRGSGLDELTDVAQVVYYDHRGAGRSDWRSPDEWALARWADDVVRLCDALGIVEPVVLGSSFGGMVVQRYLARHPGHPGGVILAGAAARPDLDLVAAAFAARGGEHAAEIARCYLAGDRSRADDYDRVCLPLYTTTPVEPTRFARVVVDPICPVPAVDEIVKALPPQQLSVVELAGASHMEAAADGIAALVREFLGELTDSREPAVV
jgi:proline iminopeptidase